MKGRKPIPTKIKLLRGNPGKRDLNLSEPQPGGPAICPDWLCSLAVEEWDRVSPELNRLGILTSVDTMSLASYCQAVAMLRRAEANISERGMVLEDGKPNPSVGQANEAMRQIRSFASEFGLSPASRSRVKIDPQIDDLDEFLKVV